jgi:hypothetical protein
LSLGSRSLFLFSFISILSSSSEILYSICSSLLQWLLPVFFSWLRNFLFPEFLGFFSWDFPYLCYTLSILFCLLYFIYLCFFIVPLVSFWSLLKSSVFI